MELGTHTDTHTHTPARPWGGWGKFVPLGRSLVALVRQRERHFRPERKVSRAMLCAGKPVEEGDDDGPPLGFDTEMRKLRVYLEEQFARQLEGLQDLSNQVKQLQGPDKPNGGMEVPEGSLFMGAVRTSLMSPPEKDGVSKILFEQEPGPVEE
ncbi:unnamed protein product, partial [Effrenium voratum]